MKVYEMLDFDDLRMQIPRFNNYLAFLDSLITQPKDLRDNDPEAYGEFNEVISGVFQYNPPINGYKGYGLYHYLELVAC